MKIELIYDRDCINVQAARANLLRAIASSGVPARWTEWDRSSPETPADRRSLGSPTVLVNGRDVADAAGIDPSGNCCRIYRSPDTGLTGAPSVELVSTAIARRSGKWMRTLGTLPGIGVALMPKLACPLCWPAYAGLLSALGLGFLLSSENLFLLTTGSLLLAVLTLAISRRAVPITLGIVASALIVTGKFAIQSNSAVYLGFLLLVAVSVWSRWPRRSSCPACVREKPASPDRR